MYQRRIPAPHRWLAGLVAALAVLTGSGSALAWSAAAGSAVSGPPVAQPPPPLTSGSVRLMAVGDVMLARGIGRAIRSDGPEVVFAGVRDVLARADILAVNLECTIGTGGTAADKHYTFRARPEAAGALVDAGVDIAGQANNHALDFGPATLAQTRELLADRGISVTGAGPNRAAAHHPVVVVRNGLRIAFLAYVAPFSESAGFNTKTWEAEAHQAGLAIGRRKEIRSDVHKALEVADLVVVLIHAGYEYVEAPSASQRRLARAAREAGATLVIGAHPHVLQGYRRHGTQLIVYSMGNFVFDKMPGEASDSAILDVTLDASGVRTVRWIPVLLRGGLPTRAHGADAKRILRRLRPI